MQGKTLGSLLALALLGHPALATTDTAEPPPEIAIRPEPPAAAARAAAMRRWHPAYHRQMAPVRRALAAVLAEISRGRTRSLGLPCHRLGAALAAVDPEQLLPVPDFAADLHLKRALAGLFQAAEACLARRTGQLIHHLDQAGAAFGNAALALRRYGLEP